MKLLPVDVPDLVSDVLDLVEGDGHALHHVSFHLLVFYLELLQIVLDTHGELGAVHHPVQLPPVLDQGVLQLLYLLT